MHSRKRRASMEDTEEDTEEEEEPMPTLFAMVSITSPLDDSQVLRPPNAQSDTEFAAFLETKRCPVCFLIPRFQAAISVPECGHEGCMSCLCKLQTCPVGRCVKYGFDKLLPFECWPQRAKASFNEDLLVKCLNCDMFKSGTVSHLLEHELKECSKRVVYCPEIFC